MSLLRHSRQSVLLLAAVATVVVQHGCAQPEAIPFDPMALQALERRAAGETRYERLPQLGTGPRDANGFLDVEALTDRAVERSTEAGFGQAATTQPASEVNTAAEVYLPLSECIRRATLNNFDVAVAAYEPAIEETRVIEAEARFDPAFRQRFEFQETDQQITNLAGSLGGAVITDEQSVISTTTSIVQLLPSGGEAELGYTIQRASSPSNVDRGLSLLETTYESDLSLRFSQPLLRDFGSDVNRARIVINQNNQQISVLEFRNQLEDLLLQVERTYWQLDRAQREVEIQTELLARTIDTTNRIRLRLGEDGDASQVAQALNSEATRRAALIQARSAVAQLSDDLKRLMNDPDLPVTGAALILPSTEPVEASLVFDLEDGIATALTFRPEIAQQQIRVMNASSAQRVGRNNVLPRLNLVFSVGVQGLDETLDGAIENQIGFDNLAYGVGIEFEIPLGNRAARSILQRSTLQRQQAIVQYAGTIQTISAEVKAAQRNVSTSYAVLVELRRAVETAAEASRVIEVQDVDGALTPEVSDRNLRFLDLLAQARSNEVQALAQYNEQLALYQRVKGTLLRYYNVTLNEADGDLMPPVGRSVDPRAW